VSSTESATGGSRAKARAPTASTKDAAARVGSILGYRRALRDQPDSPQLHSELGKALEKRGDLGAAISEYEKVLKLRPDNSHDLNELAWALCRAGRFQEALPYARRAVERDETSPNLQDTLAHAAYGTGHWDEAIRAWDAVLALNPDFFQLRGPDSNCDQDQAHYQEAKTKVSKADQTGPN
jgi:tetratricopeptide (TPR) repeat protein